MGSSWGPRAIWGFLSRLWQTCGCGGISKVPGGVYGGYVVGWVVGVVGCGAGASPLFLLSGGFGVLLSGVRVAVCGPVSTLLCLVCRFY